jgi:hypothetical protein
MTDMNWKAERHGSNVMVTVFGCWQVVPHLSFDAEPESQLPNDTVAYRMSAVVPENGPRDEVGFFQPLHGYFKNIPAAVNNIRLRWGSDVVVVPIES